MTGGLVLWSWLAVAPMTLPDAATALCAAVPDDPAASRALAATLLAKARALREGRDMARAAAALRLAVAVWTKDAAAWHELAQLEAQLGQPAAAEAAWRQAVAAQPEFALARLAFAEWLAQRGQGGDLDLAAELLRRAQREPGASCLSARVAALRGQCDDADRSWQDCARNPPRKPNRPPVVEVHLARGRCRFARGQYDAAEADWELAGAAGADISAQLALLAEARRKVAVEAQPEMRKAMATVTELARSVLHGLDRGQEPPDQGLARAVAAAPAVGIGHIALGELAARQGRFDRAELHLLRALALPLADLDRGRALRALARLCASAQPAPRWAEAAAFWSAAAPIDELPRADELAWLEALRRTGQLRAALRLATRLLARAVDGDDPAASDSLRELRAHKLALELAGGTTIDDPVAALPATHPAAPIDRARALARGDRLADAIAVVRAALRDGPAQAELWRDLAHYQRAVGDVDASVESLKRSLEVREAQGPVHWTLGRWLMDAGDDRTALRHVRRAESLGVAAAVPVAVRADLDDRALTGWVGRLADRATLAALIARLDRWEARARADPNVADRAADVTELRAAIAAEQRLAVAGQAALALVLAAVGAWAAWRRWGGATLRTLVAEHPDTGPEVQRIVAAVRHEVIKHNTLRLGAAVEALGAGDRGAALEIIYQIAGRTDSPRDKLEDYAAQLDRIGRARGVRLNLRRRDPTFAALFAGFELLGGAITALTRTSPWPVERRGHVDRRLRAAMRMLNANGYAATATLLDSMRLVRVDAVLLRAACDQVCAESAQASGAMTPVALEIHVADLWVAAPRSALNEIVVNLVRNAVQATRDGVAVTVDVDIAPITALESVVVAVRDRGPPLAASAVAQPQADHGLGLVLALVDRHGGALEVTPAPAPWTKAVAVRLPRAYPTAMEPLAAL